MSSFIWVGAIAAMILLSATPGRAAEPVTRVDIYVTPYFAASGTGQVNAVFPVTPQDGAAIPAAQATAGAAPAGRL